MKRREHMRTLGSLIEDIQSRPGNRNMFDRDTLNFFGVRLSESRLLKRTVWLNTRFGPVECYAINELQRNAPGGPVRKYQYFNVDTLEREFDDEEA